MKKKQTDTEKAHARAKKKIENLNFKKQVEQEKINIRKRNELEKFQAKQDYMYQKKLDKVNSKLDNHAKNLNDFLQSLK